ncbi:MAG TPA: hypothetical protein DCQ51_21900 [Planktothrix sp. UBA8407]|nr:hypothetical protein [Planktothrix sp. UBA8407]HBK24473.1 hypothetical protein [Planktothrix sp. UBA10369]
MVRVETDSDILRATCEDIRLIGFPSALGAGSFPRLFHVFRFRQIEICRYTDETRRRGFGNQVK